MPLIDVLYFIINSEWMPPFKLYAHKNGISQSVNSEKAACQSATFNKFI